MKPMLPAVPLRVLGPLPVFDDPRVQPFLDETQDPSVGDAVLEELDQPRLIERGEEVCDVRVEHIVQAESLSDGYLLSASCISTFWCASTPQPQAGPSALIPHAGICVGGRPQGRSLPRLVRAWESHVHGEGTQRASSDANAIAGVRR